MIRTDLLQVDTYRRPEPDAPRGHPSKVAHSTMGQSPGEVGAQPRLHQNRLWRSALEVIAEHEVQEFVKDELFLRLIREKWEGFGRRMCVRRTVAPYLTVLACLLAVAYLRGSEMSAAWPYVRADGDSPGTVMRLRDANVSSRAAFVAWIKAELPAGTEEVSVTSIVATLAMNLVLVLLCAPFLVWKGLRQRRFRIQDLDTNADAQISTEEAMLFVQKNLHFAFDVVGALLIFTAAAARLACHDSAELNLLATACIVLCFNLINVLLPFRFFGPMVIMMYKILREDVGRFLSIYLIVITGFSWGLFLLFQRADSLQGCGLPGAGGCTGADGGEPYVYRGTWSSMLWLMWVSLGDSVGAVQVSFSARLSHQDKGAL